MNPLVSIVTPVYNGAEYLAECIEGVLAQSYKDWEYVIVNNCSQDRSLEIARLYASKDPRIRVIDNATFLDAIPNHNHALRQISPNSKYCKIVFADDWLFPECVEKMVNLAEAHPSIGLVCSYGMDGTHVLWDGLPYFYAVVSGKCFCRWALLSGIYVLGTPTSQLIRSEIIRRRPEFYDAANIHTDTEVCFDLLQHSNLGFVHQVLCYSRQRPDSMSEKARRLDTYILGGLTILLKYGPRYLTGDEYAERMRHNWRHYYRTLAKSLLRLRGRQYWDYHRSRLAALGHSLDRRMLLIAMFDVLLNHALHPQEFLKMLFSYWPRKQKTASRHDKAMRALKEGSVKDDTSGVLSQLQKMYGGAGC